VTWKIIGNWENLLKINNISLGKVAQKRDIASDTYYKICHYSSRANRYLLLKTIEYSALTIVWYKIYPRINIYIFHKKSTQRILVKMLNVHTPIKNLFILI